MEGGEEAWNGKMRGYEDGAAGRYCRKGKRRTSIGYCGVKLNFNRYVSPWYKGFESIT